MNDYKIIREVGKGGMGCVYESLDSNNTKVALKMMSAKAASHPDYREMFDHEVRSLRKLSHPSIVKIVGEPFSDAGGNLFLPMEFVEGKTISQIVQANGAFNEQEALSIFIKLLDAFSYIHNRSCIHRDVKPSNIMIRPDGSICVIDFGIAKDSKTSTGKTIGRVVGTDGYMSPEQANGYNIDTRTDIYSLGCLLHYMLTGTHAIPKQSNDYDTICAILENNFPLVSDKGFTVSEKTQKAILTAVNKNMTLRYQNAEEFKAALNGEQKAKTSYTISVGRLNPTWGPSRNCDIIMEGEYVSSYHLDIIWESQDDNGSSYKVTIKDHSTNGTGVNGRKIKNESYSFMVNQSIKSLMKDHSNLPQVMIAGLASHVLNWEQVLNFLFHSMDLPTSIIDECNDDTDVHGGLVVPPKSEDITVGYGILCFVIPIAGWILGAVWKSENPIKAKSANKLAWYGFLFNLVMSFLSGIISSAIQ